MIKTIIFSIVLTYFIACSSSSTDEKLETKIFDSSISPIQTANWYKPNVNTSWQWQLKNNINKSYHVDIYDIDLFDSNTTLIESLKNNGKKVICYFSAGSYENWRNDKSSFPTNILGNDMDGWSDEKWLDISNEKLAPIMKKRLDLAVQKGCDGVEPDNMDAYSNNTGFNITSDDQLAYNIFIANEARKRGLSVALKNDLDQIVELEPYFDFAINEQCNEFNECDKLMPFINSNKPVFNVEYHSKYIVNNEINNTLCTNMNNIKFQTLVLPLNLDDNYRYSCNKKDNIINNFGIGFGGSSSFKFQDDSNNSIWVSATDLMLDKNISNNNYYKNIKDFNTSSFINLQDYLSKAKFFTMWASKNWEEPWFNIVKINEAVSAGKIPVFVYWYFGDDLTNGMPNDAEILEYKENNIKFSNFLKKIHGHKLVIIEPEFNKKAVLDNAGEFINIMSDAIDIIKDENISLSLCMTDTGSRGVNQTYARCGYANCSLGDKYAWDKPKDIYNALLPKLDFISFQEMLGQFSRDPSSPGTWNSPNPKSLSVDELGVDFLAKRLENFGKYLFELYKKPVYLPYITIATATWNDLNSNSIIDSNEINKSGFESNANKVYMDINNTLLKQNYIFGYSVMSLFDNPKHDMGGYQYFMNNEYHLGIIKSSARDEIDNGINGDIKSKQNILSNIFK